MQNRQRLVSTVIELASLTKTNNSIKELIKFYDGLKKNKFLLKTHKEQIQKAISDLENKNKTKPAEKGVKGTKRGR